MLYSPVWTDLGVILQELYVATEPAVAARLLAQARTAEAPGLAPMDEPLQAAVRELAHAGPGPLPGAVGRQDQRAGADPGDPLRPSDAVRGRREAGPDHAAQPAPHPGRLRSHHHAQEHVHRSGRRALPTRALPPRGTVCAPDFQPFDQPTSPLAVGADAQLRFLPGPLAPAG
jgi:hypothetical protein